MCRLNRCPKVWSWLDKLRRLRLSLLRHRRLFLLQILALLLPRRCSHRERRIVVRTRSLVELSWTGAASIPGTRRLQTTLGMHRGLQA